MALDPAGIVQHRSLRERAFATDRAFYPVSDENAMRLKFSSSNEKLIVDEMERLVRVKRMLVRR